MVLSGVLVCGALFTVAASVLLMIILYLVLFHPFQELVDGQPPEEEVLAAVDVPPGKMGLIIGKKGISILEIKKSCRCDIFIGGQKGPPDKVFAIGAVKEVRKAEAILRGKFIPN